MTKRPLTPVLVLAMALPSSVLYSVGAVGPQITEAFGVSRSALGVLPVAAFGTAAVLSLWSGGLVDRIGSRAALLLLLGIASTAFVLMGVATGYVTLIAAMALSGLGQALSNPATNRAITERVAPAARAMVVGRKQAGTQLSALVVGLTAPLLTELAGWRAVLLAGAPIALAAAALTVKFVPPRRGSRPTASSAARQIATSAAWSTASSAARQIATSAAWSTASSAARQIATSAASSTPTSNGSPTAQPTDPPTGPPTALSTKSPIVPSPAPSWRPARPNRYLALLMLFLAALGCAVSSVTTFGPLYGHERLAQSTGMSAALIAAFGLAGVLSRLAWSRRAANLPLLSPLLRQLAAGAAISALLIWASTGLGTPALWAGIIGVGATAVGANAVAMILVVRDRRTGPIGPASALLSLGFFAGFVIWPVPLGLIADSLGYGPAWLLVAALFLTAAALAKAVLRHERPAVSA